MSKGGGSQTVTQKIDPDVKAAYLTNLGYSRDVANDMGVRRFAGYNPQYEAGENIIAGAVDGAGYDNLNTAADLTSAAAGYAPMSVTGESAGPAALAGSQGYRAAQFTGVGAGPAAQFAGVGAGPAAQFAGVGAGPAAQFAGVGAGPAAQFAGVGAGPAAQFAGAQANMAGIGNYMNPYTSQVIDASLADLEQARQAAGQQIGQQATAAKAFGGSRHGVSEALSNARFGEQAGKTIAQLRAQGFDTAANLMQQDVGRQQQAGLANQGALNQMGQFNAGQFQQAGLANQAALNQMGQFNAGQFQQAGLANQGALNQASQFGAGASNTASLANQGALNQMAQYNANNRQQANLANQGADLQGAQFRLNAANQLGALGQNQTGQAYAAGQALMGLGGARQNLEQQRLDATRNLGLERLGIMQGALGLQPANLGGSTTQPLYQNTGANILGGAMGGASLAGMLGMGAGTGAGIGALLGLI
jgi:hypothetical protein